MDKIYSRRRIMIPKITFNNGGNSNKDKNKVKLLKILIILIIGITTANLIMKSINPIINNQCSQIAKSIATKISNEQATIVMGNYKYQDLCTITKDTNGNISMISANIIPINEIISDIPIRIQNELNNTENSKFKMKLGSFTGSRILSGMGPDVNIKMSTIGNLDTDLKSEITSVGINQTLHRIYLEIKCKVVILTPFNTMEEEITNQVLLIESIIVGTTPNTYYNLEGLDKSNLYDVID